MENMDLDILNRQSEEVKAFFSVLNELLNQVEETIGKNKPSLNGERFIGNEDVCKMLHIAPRTLQDYRDKGRISFFKLEGKILYRQSDIDKMLWDNFFPAIE